MRIAIAGGTGTLGRGVAGELRSRGHEVRVLSRRSGQYRVDLVTEAGLGPALDGALTAAARWRVLPVPRAALQTVASGEVARVVAHVAEGAPRLGRVEVAGPEVADAREMARIWRSATGRRALLLPVPLPGQLGRALRRGVLVSQRPDVTGTVRFADWLASPVPVSR